MRSVYLSANGLDTTLQKFRVKNDPLGKLIEPHITLVFPFESSMSDLELVELVSIKVSSFGSFSATLNTEAQVEKDYLYFSILEGANQIKRMHECLYKGPLSVYLKKHIYIPHLTIGRGERDRIALMQEEANALEVSKYFRVSKLKIENIEPDGKSTAIKEILLNP